MTKRESMKDTAGAVPNENMAPASPPGEDLFSGFVGKLGRDAVRYLPAVVVPSVLSIVAVAVFTRMFEAGPYGQYSLALVTTTIATAIVGGWMPQSIIRYLPQQRGQRELNEFKQKLNTVLWMVIAATAALTLLGYVAFRSRLGEFEPLYLPAAALLLAWFVFGVYTSMFRANLQSAAYARYQILWACGRLLFSLALVILVSRHTAWLLAGSAIAYAVLIVPMMWELGLTGRALAPRFDRLLFKKLLTFGVPIVGWGAAIRVLDVSDRYVIAYFRGGEEVGIYAANYSLATMAMGFVATPILLAAHPLIVTAWEQGSKRKIQDVVSMFSRYFILIAIPTTAFISVYSKEIAELVFGEAFREGYIVIPLILVGLTLWNFGMYGHKGLKLLERTGLMFRIVLLCTVVNVVLNMGLVPLLGYFGAAVATLISYGLYPVVVYFVTKRQLAWKIPWRSVARVVASAAIAATFWLLTSVSLVSGVVGWLWFVGSALVGITLYLASLLLLGELREYEKRYLLAWFRRGGAAGSDAD